MVNLFIFLIKNKFEDISLDVSFELQAPRTMIKCWKNDEDEEVN